MLTTAQETLAVAIAKLRHWILCKWFSHRFGELLVTLEELLPRLHILESMLITNSEPQMSPSNLDHKPTLNFPDLYSYTASFLLNIRVLVPLLVSIIAYSVLWLFIELGIVALWFLLQGIRIHCVFFSYFTQLLRFIFQPRIRHRIRLLWDISMVLELLIHLCFNGNVSSPLHFSSSQFLTIPINRVVLPFVIIFDFLLVYYRVEQIDDDSSTYIRPRSLQLTPPTDSNSQPAIISYVTISELAEESEAETLLINDLSRNSDIIDSREEDEEKNNDALDEPGEDEESRDKNEVSEIDALLLMEYSDFESDFLHDTEWQPESNHDISLAAQYLGLDKEEDLPPHPMERNEANFVFTTYKRVDKKVRPIDGQFPESAQVRRTIPEDPLLTLPPLSKYPPQFKPTTKLTQERLDSIKINPDNYLSEQEELLFIQVLVNNEEALAFGEADRGTLKESYFSPYIMPTVPHKPWQVKHRPIAPGIRQQVIEILKEKIKGGVYEPSQSSYRSNWFCVKKKTAKSLRIVHDLQPLNLVSIRDAGVPPMLDDFVEPFAGAQCYTVFDLFCGFDARKLAPESRDLTTFLTPLGPLRHTAMPMGYTNSPAEFQQSMVFILQPEIPTVANIFIDDLPIKGPSTRYLDDSGMPEVLPENPGIRRFIWEHAVDVNRVMHRVKHAGATFSAKKIQLCKPEVIIIGQKCTPEGRLPDTDRVSKILNWPVLKTPKEARGFLGLCGGVRIWIKNYSQLARPLTELWRRDEEFEWNDRRQEAFETLKKLVSSAPALRAIDYESDLPVILAVDSSYLAVGFILSQMDEQGRRRPARYGSIPMNEREARYSQPKLELYGLFRALRAYRIYLVGVKNLVVEVDAKYIKGMLNEPDLQPNAAMNRWIQGILLFDFKLVHVPAEKHIGPDALSRRELGEGEIIEDEDDEWLDDMSLHTEIIDSPEYCPAICYSETTDQVTLLRQIFEFLTTLQAPYNPDPQSQKRFIQKTLKYFVDDERYMWRRTKGGPVKVILSKDRQNKILNQAHEELGHRGVKSVFETLRTRFYWPAMWASIKSHVASCHECQIRSTIKLEIPLTISAPVALFSKVYIDVMNMPTADGFKYIVAARDDLSRASEGKALKRNNSQALAEFFWEHIYCRYGAVQHVVTDNGPEMKKAFKRLLERLGIPQIKISPYNSKANGVVERGHFTIREAILKSCKGDVSQWPSKVQPAFFADRIAISPVTGFSAYYLLYGTHPLLPFDLTESTFMVTGFKSGMKPEDLLALRIRQLEKRPEDIARAAKVLREARFRSKREFERKFRRRFRKKEMYKTGELVLIRNTQIEKEMNRKHKPRYLGPFEVLRQTKGGSYVLRQLDGPVLRQAVGAFRLVPYIERDLRGLKPRIEESEIDSNPESDTGDSNSDSPPSSE